MLISKRVTCVDKIRVLQIVPSFRLGGAERMATQLMCNLDRNRFIAEAISLEQPVNSELERILAQSQIPVHFLNKHAGPDPRMVLAVTRVLQQVRPHVVHSHMHVLRYTLFPTIWCRIPVRLHTIHTIADRQHGRAGRLINFIAFRSGVFPVGIAQEIRESIYRTYHLDRAALIPNGIPVSRYSRPQIERSTWRKQEGFSDGDTLFVSVARLCHAKNPRMLIRAFSSIVPHAVSAHLLLVGDGAQRLELLHLVHALGIEGNVHFLSERNDVPDILAAADIFVLASNREGNPLSVMEAMAAAKPVIGTTVGGIPELVENDKTGILVKCGDEQALAKAMKRLLGNPVERQAMGEQGARKARTEFDISTMTRLYEALYEQLLLKETHK